MKKSVVCFLFPRELTACIFALFYFTSIGYASPQPSTENNVHFCLPLNLEDMQARDSIYAATKHALNLNVGEPRTVRMIYFLPNDRPFRQEVVDSMKVAIRQIQTFYVEQMQAHGHGNKTFRFETDIQGDPMVHRVDGQYPDSHYLANTSATVLKEFEQAFDRDANIYLIVVDNSINAIGSRGQRVGGTGGDRGKNGGFGLVHGGFSFHTAAHELGHAFGLQHDFNANAYIMSYSSGQRYSLSACNAEFLAVHPYFNLSVEAQEAPPPTIEITSPLGYPAGSRSVSIQLKVSDTDDLHQVILFVSTRKPHLAAGSLEVKACRGLNSAKESVVEFDYNGVIPSDGFTRLWNPDVHPISIRAVDTQGNVRTETFSLWEISPHRIATLEHSPYSSAGLIPTVESVAYSPDGTMLASGSGRIKLWDVSARRDIATLEGHTGTVHSVAFSSDGTTLASGSSDETVKLWDVTTKENIATLEGHKSWVSSVTFSPDGTTLASGAGEDKTVKLWDIATGRTLATLEGHTGWVTSVAFSLDGTTLASGSGQQVKLWDVATQTNIATLEGHTDIIRSVAFSPDGTTLVSGGEDGVRVWDVLTQNISTLEGHSRNVFFSSFSSDGKMLAGGVDGMFKLWDINTGHPAVALEGHMDEIRSVAFSPDGITLASTSYDNTIKLWDISTGRTIATLEGHTEHIHSVVFSPDGTTLASWGNLGVEIWDVAMGSTIATLNGDTSWISSMMFSPDGVLLAVGSGDRMVKLWLWGISTGRNIVTLEGHSGRVLSVAVSPDGTILASREQNEVKLWDVATGRTITTLEWPPWLHVNSVVFSPDGTMLASGDNSGWIELWEVSTGRNIATFEGHMSAVDFVAFSPDGMILASGGYFNDEVKLWNVMTGRTIATFEHSGVSSIMFSPDGMLLASRSSYGTVLLWDMSLYIAPQTPDPDFNGDGQVDLSDFLLFASQFGLSRGDEQYDAKYDLDRDGTIACPPFFVPYWLARRSSTTVGSARVEVSPRSEVSSSAILRRMRRMIFPDRVLGNPGAQWITSGVAMGPISVRTCWTSSALRSSV